GQSVPIHWRCYSRHCEQSDGLKPTLLGLVRGALRFQRGDDVRLGDAAKWLNDFLDEAGAPAAGELPRRPKPKAATPPPRPRPRWPRAAVRARLAVPSAYFLSRGFSPEVLDAFDVGDSARLGGAVVPFHDNDTGESIVGFQTRMTGPACPQCGKWHAPNV